MEQNNTEKVMEETRVTMTQELLSGYIGCSFWLEHENAGERFSMTGGKILHIALMPEGIELECERILIKEDEIPRDYDLKKIAILHQNLTTGVFLREDGALRLCEDRGDMFLYHDDGHVIIDRWIDIMTNGIPPW